MVGCDAFDRAGFDLRRSACDAVPAGIGESVTYPASSRVLASLFPEKRRGLANSLVDLGVRIGPAAGTFCGALLVSKLGWRGLFAVTGGAGLLWLIPWMMVAPRVLEPSAAAGKTAGPGWKGLLKRQAVWGTCGGLCGANYAWYFILSWLPSYLVRERHFSLNSLAFWGSAPFLLMAVSSLSGGILADGLISRGGSPVKVWKSFLVTGLLLTAAFMSSVLLPRVEWAVAGLLTTCFMFGIYASNLFALTQALAGPSAAGRWTGLQNAFGNLDGLPFGRKLIIPDLNQGPFFVMATPRGEPGGFRTQYNLNFDQRISRRFDLGKFQMTLLLDVFNLLNSNKNLREVDISGPQFVRRQPLDIQNPRVFRFGIRLGF